MTSAGTKVTRRFTGVNGNGWDLYVGDRRIGSVTEKVTHYNLVRAFVTRERILYLDGLAVPADAKRSSHERLRDAVEHAQWWVDRLTPGVEG